MNRLAIDWTRCDGNGLCAELLPELISRDEWGYPILADAPVRDAAGARRPAALCQALALRLEQR